MDCHKWLAVFAAVSLANSSAQARPGNYIADVPEQQSVSSSKDAHMKSDNSEDIKSSTEKVEETKTIEVTKAVNERFPHAVRFTGTCGGSIISDKWILTAGHCSLHSKFPYVLAGTNRSDDGSGIKRPVKRLVLHPKFSVGPFWVDANKFDIKQVAANWDFMLAELEDPLPLNGKTIDAVDINDQPEVPEGLAVAFAGYGAEDFGEYMRSDMRSMGLEVMADSACQEALVQYEPENMLCAKGRGPSYDSTCNGDSGSGLVADGKLYGVLSWAQDDAHSCFNSALVAFARVSAVRDWIRQVTKI